MKNIFILFTTFLVLTSCDWREFDDLSDQTTAQVIDAPSGFSGATFGQIIAPVTDADNKIIPANYLVAGSGLSPIVLISFSNGNIVSKIFSYNEELVINKISKGIKTQDGIKFLAAENKFGRVHLFTIDPDSPDLLITEDQSSLTGGAGFGNDIKLVNSTQELLVASNDSVFYYNNFDANQGRILPLPDTFELPTYSESSGFEPFNILESFTDEDNLSYFVVGGSITDTNGDRQWATVIVPLYSLGTQDSSMVVMLKGSDLYPGEAVNSLKMADVNDDQIEDLLIGAGNSIYVFYSQNNSDILADRFSKNPNVILYNEGVGAGYCVEVTDLNEDGKPEVITSNPFYQVGGSKRLGVVEIYKTPFVGNKHSPAVIIDVPDGEKMFGSSVIGIPSQEWTNRNELIVGGLNASYILYLTGLEGDNDSKFDDPRKN